MEPDEMQRSWSLRIRISERAYLPSKDDGARGAMEDVMEMDVTMWNPDDATPIRH